MRKSELNRRETSKITAGTRNAFVESGPPISLAHRWKHFVDAWV
jgi:hypothetical protein